MRKKLIRSLISVVFITLTRESTNAQREILRRQTVITSPDNLEEFYLLVKRILPLTYVDDGQAGYLRNEDYSGSIILQKYKQLTIPRRSELLLPGVDQEMCDLEQKSRVCAHIFNSVSFQALRNEEAVDFSPQRLQTRRELELANSRLFNAIYVGVRWLNPYVQYNVSVKNRKLKERVFSCVTRERATGEYMGYFISPIYQLHAVAGSINGRFVFTAGEQDELELFARAEEPAVVDENIIEQTQLFYYNSAKRNQSSSEPEAERCKLCTLSVAEKIRVCSLIFNAVEFEGPVNMTISYNEWMIGCKVVSDEGSISTNYISEGWDRYTAIVFQPLLADRYKPIFGLYGVGPLSEVGLVRPITLISKTTNSRRRY